MFGKKKTISTAYLDLRNYSPNALTKIKRITASVIILAKEAEQEYYDAFSQIRVICPNILKLSSDALISIQNGFSEINSNTVNPNAIYIISGFSIIHSLPDDVTVRIIINGCAIVDSVSHINPIQTNGSVLKVNFDIEKSKIYENSLMLDKQFLTCCKNNYTIIVGNELTITPEISIEDLQNKNINFIVGNKINCNKGIYGYIAANSVYGNKIELC